MRTLSGLVLLLCAVSAQAGLMDEVRVYGVGGKSMTNWHGQADVQTLNVEVTHRFTKHWSAGTVIGPMNLWQPRSWFGDLYGEGSENVRAINTALLARRTWRPDSPRANFFIEVGSGPMWSTKRVPAHTSHFNFVSSAGFGFVVNPNSRYPIVAGYRFMHISNAGYAPRNPGLNISAAMVGVQVRR